jgi:ATP-dependent helicase HrpA
MNQDRHPLRSQINKFFRHGVPDLEQASVTAAFQKIQHKIEQSQQLALKRQASVPVVSYPEELPISGKREDILALVKAHPVVIVAGETGSGKTTQLPKICLEAGRGVSGLIAHTQPRRIAARTVASRIAEELGVKLGETVGYQVRFKDHSTEHSLVKLMTDGILLAEIQRDRFLNRYDTIIIDEAHERSLNIDFLLGYLKQLLPKRPDLKIIITSATIDVERFSKHFNDAPIVEVSGRTYPVEYRYRPMLDDVDINEAVNEAVEELIRLPQKGDILVFFSGEREIRQAAQSLRRCQFPHLEILPLYARLNLAEQNRIFQPHRGVRVVLATNVAETSLTVPGIRYVIDTGLARISRYSYRTKVQQLPIEPISQASANQRAGRCGRLSDGICIRFYSEEDYSQRPAFTTPEILRTNLAAVILQMLRLRIGDVRAFPFLEPPDNRLVNDGFALLKELKAADGKEQLTADGRKLAQFSVDPRLGKMLLAAEQEGCVREVLIIVSALSIQDPRERPSDKRTQADQQHAQWRDKRSDFVSILNLWEHFEEQRQALSRNQFARYCRKSFVSYSRMVEWRDLHHQLHMDCRHNGLATKSHLTIEDGYDPVHRAVLAGLLAHIGFLHEAREYEGVRNRRFHVFPGSGLAAKPPKWVMSAELIETTRLYAHYNAAINVEWLLPLASHLVKKHHSEPHYDASNGQVMAYEKQTLYGLTIAERLRVKYGAIDPKVCREIFIQSALVEGGYLKSSLKLSGSRRRRSRGEKSKDKSNEKNKKPRVGEFAKHNAELLAHFHELEERMRRRDILADEAVLYQFYDRRIPADVVSLATFERWRKTAEVDAPRLLFIDRELLSNNAPSQEEEAQFPKTIEWADVVYKLSYRFDPGHPEDGVSVAIPISILHQVPKYRFDWLVPGLLRDKCIALIKKLPKQWRKNFVPVPEFVDRLLPRLTVDNRPLHEVLGEQLAFMGGATVPVDAWQTETLDVFYRMNFRLLDEQGRVLENSRDLEALRASYRQHVQSSIENNAAPEYERSGLTQWDFDDLPEVHLIKKNKHTIRVYPTLHDDGDSVSVRLCDSAELAEYQMAAGVIRLAMQENLQTVKYLHKDLFKKKDLLLKAAQLPDRKTLSKDIIRTAFFEACFRDKPLPRCRVDFFAQVERGKKEVLNICRDMEVIILGLAEQLANLHRARRDKLNNFPDVSRQILSHLASLLAPGFCFDAGVYWLRQYPKYIKAMHQRIEKHLQKSQQEDDFTEQIAGFTEALVRLRGREDECLPALREQIKTFRFMIEEYYVSHYAQQLKTIVPVSNKRLSKQLQLIETALD